MKAQGAVAMLTRISDDLSHFVQERYAFKKPHLDAYVKLAGVAEPADEFEDRVLLYSL